MRILLAVLATSGLFGQVSRGPTRPVCIVGKPCSAPVVGARLEFLRGGAIVRWTRTGTGGRYRIELLPGLYTVRVVRLGKPAFRFEPTTVRVPSGAAVRTNFAIDTGIR